MRVKTPCLLQSETTDCGAVVLGIILQYYGCDVPLTEIKRQMSIARDGVSPEIIAQTSRWYGINATIREGALPSLDTLGYPAILFWKGRHFVVLEGFKNNKVYINDPAHGRCVIDRDILYQHFSNVIIECQLTPQFKMRKENKRFSGLYSLFKQEYASLVFVFFTAMVLTLSNLITPFFSQAYIDHYLRRVDNSSFEVRRPAACPRDPEILLNTQVDSTDKDRIRSRGQAAGRRNLNCTHPTSTLAAVLLSMLIVQCSLTYMQRKILRRLECKMAFHQGAKLIRKILQLPVVFFAHRRLGDLVSIFQANERLSEALVGPIWTALTNLIQMITYLSVLFYYSIPLSLVVCTAAMLHVIYFVVKKEKQHRLASSTKQELMNVTSMTLNHLSMVPQLKAMGNQNDFFSRWQRQFIRYLKVYHELSFLNARTPAIGLFIVSATTGILLISGMVLVTKGLLTIGTLIAFNTLFFSFNETIIQSLNLVGKWSGLYVDYQKTTELMSEAIEPDIPPSIDVPIAMLTPARRGKIELIDVTFGYNRMNKPLFENFNMVVDAESRIAIVGASGSGKSTLAKLLTGIYKPWSGFVLIDGCDLSSISAEERSTLIGMVNQEQFFFKGSIKENLNVWSASFESAQMMQAARTACIDDYILELKEGFNFQLTEGASNLSGGQRQRLEIARTLLHNPRVLILDEATSALDTITESNIDKNMRKDPRTLITIAHRFNTIFDADKLFILQDGVLVDSGSHQSLVTRKSQAYLDLFNLNPLPKEQYA